MINISKKDALKYLENTLNNTSQKEIMDLIYETTVLGRAASDENAMSYFCRAYNITAFGVEHQYRNVLNDFLQEFGSDPIRRAFSQLFTRYPNGISKDFPTFADMLEAQIKLNNENDEKLIESHESMFNIFSAFGSIFGSPRVRAN
ncbi:hypothetical protein [Oribacterium sp. WCC10]|uniref:hypothetical protein n=1 Tax=Oribacterium sp. WCC10 TaxID=1855343 RepID=UPI0008E325AB|nr:hypothetical protein [Oribacterium sp. WCC10]SFG63750.1 hypothetical protein SAMN05216356_11639 [Oribacterium sp. WCC10]